jgi:hypothetical protein
MSDCDHENFINRDYEIGLVVNMVSDLAKGKPFSPKERVFHFVGPSRIGKSCLLKRCKGVISRIDCISLLVRLDTLKGGKRGFTVELLDTVHNEFCKCKDVTPPGKNDTHGRLQFARHVQKKINGKNQIPVLLLDEINSPPLRDIREIEEQLLVKFLHDNDRAILVTAGRSQPVAFNDFALRPNSSNIFPLPVFDEEKTSRQMESLKLGTGKLAKKVVKLGSGVPGNTVKLMEHVSGNPPDISNEGQAIQVLVNGIKHDNKIEARFYPMLEAISILKGFFPEDVVTLFQEHLQLGSGWNEGRVKEVFLELNRIEIGPGGLVNWDRDKTHWAMDESTRDLFEKELQMRDPELWKKLHCTALGMYQEWGEKYNSDLYRNKSNYHKQRLQSVELNCSDLEG